MLDILIDGFQRNEVFGGCHWRSLPMPDEEAAARKFEAWLDEVRRWKGAPTRIEDRAGRRIAAWPDIELRQSGRGVMVRVRAPDFGSWWHASDTWSGDPMGDLHAWAEEDDGSA